MKKPNTTTTESAIRSSQPGTLRLNKESLKALRVKTDLKSGHPTMSMTCMS